MKAIILLLVVAALAGLIVLQFKTLPGALENHQKKVTDLSASKGLAEQQTCHDQAQARFVKLGLAGQASETVKSHFSVALGKCFVQIENTSTSLDIVWKNVTLSDAISGDGFGRYSWRSAPGQKPSDVPPFTCEVTQPSGEKKECTSEDEFRNLVKVYMN
jgi:hypothetical protein